MWFSHNQVNINFFSFKFYDRNSVVSLQLITFCILITSQFLLTWIDVFQNYMEPLSEEREKKKKGENAWKVPSSSKIYAKSFWIYCARFIASKTTDSSTRTTKTWTAWLADFYRLKIAHQCWKFKSSISNLNDLNYEFFNPI